MHHSRLVAGLIAVVLVTTGAPTATGQSAETTRSAPRLVLDDGHIDLFEVTYDATSDSFQMHVKDDTGIYTREDRTAFRAPDRVALQVDRARSRVVIPEGLEQPWYDLLGEPGTVLFILDEIQTEGLPWPGWSTERLAGQLEKAGITLTESDYPAYAGAPALALDLDISGPGEVITWMNDSVPIHNFIDTRAADLDSIPVPVGAHVHTSWGFTEPGSYAIKVTPYATKDGGGTLTGPPATYHINIGGRPVRVTQEPRLRGAARIGSTVRIRAGAWRPERPVVRYEWTIGDIEVSPLENDVFRIPRRINGIPTKGQRLRVVAVARAEGRSTTRVPVADRLVRPRR